MSDNTETTSDNLPAVIPKHYTLKETATKLGVSAKTVRRMIDRGELAGAYQAPMATGKGTQWVVPYLSVISHETKTPAPATPDPVNAELIALRERVAQLENSLNVQQELARERAHQLEQLHSTFRIALTVGEEPKRKKLFRRK